APGDRYHPGHRGQQAVVPELQPPPRHPVRADHPRGATVLVTRAAYLFQLAQRAQVKVGLQQQALQLPALLGDGLLQPVMGKCPDLRVGEVSDEPVEGVLRLLQVVSGGLGVVRCLHRALPSSGTGWLAPSDRTEWWTP